MRVYDIITKKKRAEELSCEEIDFLISGYTRRDIPDYQISALLMAICLNGMSEGETAALTRAIAASGDSVDLSEFGTLSADKHSTGGVGDKTTLVAAPLAAALGCKVAKMSGRGLGHTGGTIDKLESFEGYRVTVSPEDFKRQVRDIGIAVIGQSGNLAPADKKLYALRDVTATVDSIPLIASSVMGKKLAAGSHAIVLDVKCGSGAFVKTPAEAEELARAMVKIGNSAGRRCAALITNMDLPLGFAVGNILEVKEAISTLRGEGPSDLAEICVALAAAMAHLTLGISREDATSRARKALGDGSALKKFREWIGAQGGDTSPIDNPDLFPRAAHGHAVFASRDGYISGMNAELIGLSAMELGAGRRTKDDPIDYTAGIILERKTGDKISVGDRLATLYTNDENSIPEAEKLLLSSLSFSDTAPQRKELIYKTVI